MTLARRMLSEEAMRPEAQQHTFPAPGDPAASTIMNTPMHRPAAGALLVLLALLPLLAACDIEASEFTLEDQIHLTFTFHGSQAANGEPIVIQSNQRLDLLAVVRQNSFTADEVVSARIAAIGARPEIEITLPFTERLNAFAAVELRAANTLLLSGSAFGATRTATLIRAPGDMAAVVRADPERAFLTIEPAGPLQNASYTIHVVFDVVIGVRA
jgi:hypothetical protein